MWLTAKKRFLRHACVRNPCPSSNLSLHSLPEAWGPWEPQYVPPDLHYACIMPIPSLQLQKKAPVSCREAKWSPRFVTILWLCSQLYYETAANQCLWSKLFATVGWKWGCQPFSCRRPLNETHWRKEICSTCLSKESIPAIPFRNSQHPLPTRSLRSLRAAVGSAISALNYACIMPIPWLQLQKKPVLCTEVIVSKIWITGYRLRSQLWHVTAAKQWTTMSHCWDWAFSKWGCQAVSCWCSKNVTHWPAEICSTCLSKGIHAFCEI